MDQPIIRLALRGRQPRDLSASTSIWPWTQILFTSSMSRLSVRISPGANQHGQSGWIANSRIDQGNFAAPASPISRRATARASKHAPFVERPVFSHAAQSWIRRAKCDEGYPTCHRCTSTGRVMLMEFRRTLPVRSGCRPLDLSPGTKCQSEP